MNRNRQIGHEIDSYSHHDGEIHEVNGKFDWTRKSTEQ